MPTDGDYIRDARKARWLTREDVARATGISAITIRNIEQGTRRNPNVDTIMVLSSFLGLDPSRVLIHPVRGKPWLTKSRYDRLR